jgi:hypothetical protein
MTRAAWSNAAIGEDAERSTPGDHLTQRGVTLLPHSDIPRANRCTVWTLHATSRRLHPHEEQGEAVIRKLKSGEYRLYSRKKNPKTGKRRNLGTFKSRAAAEKHERAVQYFKRA